MLERTSPDSLWRNDMKNKEKITKLLEDYIKENLELKELELSKLTMKELEDLVNEKARKSSR